MKYVVANWKGHKPDNFEEWLKTLIIPDNVKVIICRGHNGEVGVELR